MIDRRRLSIPAPRLPVGAAFQPPPEVAPGVLAAVREIEGYLIVSFIWSTSPGQGNVGRWLDTLSRERPVIMVEVLDATPEGSVARAGRLSGMLARRGYKPGRAVFTDAEANVWWRWP